MTRRISAINLVLATLGVLLASIAGIGAVIHWELASIEANYRERDAGKSVYWRGEILFPQSTHQESDLCSIQGFRGPFQIMALSPQTGKLREFGITISNKVIGLVSDDRRLLVVGSDEIVEVDGDSQTRFPLKGPSGDSTNSVIKLEPISDDSSRLYRTLRPFVMNQSLMSISVDDRGRCFLSTFEDGQWKIGRRIALPGIARRWSFDEERNQIRLVPRTTALEKYDSWNLYDGSESVAVISNKHEFVVVSIANYWGRNDVEKRSREQLCYRTGFDFVDKDPMILSALDPENAPTDATNWHELPSQNIAGSPLPIDLAVQIAPGRFVRHFFEVDPHETNPSYEHNQFTFVHSADFSESYIVYQLPSQEIGMFKQVGGQFEKLPNCLPGSFESVIRLDNFAICFGIAAFALSQFVLIAGADWSIHSSTHNQFEFGREVVSLASLKRRWLARGVDLFFQWIPLITIVIWRASTLVQRVRMEHSPAIVFYYFSHNHIHNGIELLNHTRISILSNLDFQVGIACCWALLYSLTSTVMQGRSGTSPGKWFAGIRVVRTTLRRCGFARSLVRELLFFPDTLNLLMPIPAVAAMVHTTNRQRIGDLVADTIVIETKPDRSN